MNAIELLKSQHRAIDILFARLGAPGEPVELADTVIPAVAASQHPDGRTETMQDADDRFRDEGGASAMDASAAEYGAATKGHDPGTEGIDMESAPAALRDDSAGRCASPAVPRAPVPHRQFDDSRQGSFDELAKLLVAHATVEEQIFYPAVRSEQTDDLLFEAIEEHASVRRLIDELRRMRHTDKDWDDKFLLLREKVANHVRDEETELFPNVEEVLGSQRLQELGGLIERRYWTLLGVRLEPHGRESAPNAEAPKQARQPTGTEVDSARRLR